MKNYIILLISICTLFSFSYTLGDKPTEDPIGTLKVAYNMDLSPGNVAVSKGGRVFSTVHPLRRGDLQFMEIVGDNEYIPFPNKEMQSTPETISNSNFDSPLGIVFDNRNRLWMVDVGLTTGKARVFSYDINTKKELYRFEIPQEIASKGTFIQDLSIDEDNGFVYLADAMDPGIIVIDIKKGSFRRIVDLPSMGPEDIDMVIDDKVQYFFGEPMRISIDPITISKDRETLYYGAMNGTKWYKLPTKVLREGASDNEIIKQISVVGKKPICDGAATDDEGNHYFTNLQNHSIDVLTKEGEYRTLKKDSLFDWPDNIRIHGDWLYIAANQTHKSSAFTGDKDISEAPFRILKLKFK